jgi:phospholipase D1/2
VILEHLGLIPPQDCDSRNPTVTNDMRPAPYPATEMTYSEEDRLVADPLIHETDQLWKETARKNREIFTEIFRPLPSNLVQNVNTYDVCINLFFHLPRRFFYNTLIIIYQLYIPKGKVGHVVKEVPLSRVKDRLNLVRGSLVECPLVSVTCFFRRQNHFFDPPNRIF